MTDALLTENPPVVGISPSADIPMLAGPSVLLEGQEKLPDAAEMAIDRLGRGVTETGEDMSAENALETFNTFKDTVLQDPSTTEEKRNLYEKIDKAIQDRPEYAKEVVDAIGTFRPQGLDAQAQELYSQSLEGAREALEGTEPEKKLVGAKKMFSKFGELYRAHPKLSMAFLGIFVVLGMAIAKGFKSAKGGNRAGYGG